MHLKQPLVYALNVFDSKVLRFESRADRLERLARHLEAVSRDLPRDHRLLNELVKQRLGRRTQGESGRLVGVVDLLAAQLTRRRDYRIVNAHSSRLVIVQGNPAIRLEIIGLSTITIFPDPHVMSYIHPSGS